MLIHVIVRSPHNEQPRKNMNKHSSHPGCHCVSLRSSKMNVEYNHGYTYTAKYNNVCEKRIMQQNEAIE